MNLIELKERIDHKIDFLEKAGRDPKDYKVVYLCDTCYHCDDPETHDMEVVDVGVNLANQILVSGFEL